MTELTEACAGFWAGESGTYPSRVELGLGSMVGRTMTRDVSRGGCGLRKSVC